MKELEAIVKKIITYLDASRPGDPRNANVIKALAQFDPDMAKAYAEREVKVQRAMEKIQKERKEHRENQMVILYKKYVDAAAAAEKARRLRIIQRLKKLEQDLLSALEVSEDGKNAASESEQEHREWLDKIEKEWEIWPDKEGVMAELETSASQAEETAAAKTDIAKPDEAEPTEQSEDADTADPADDTKADDANTAGAAEKEKQVLTNKEKQMQVYREVSALYEALDKVVKENASDAASIEKAEILRSGLGELKQYMDDISQGYKSGITGKDRITQAACYYDKQRKVTDALRGYLAKDIQTEKERAIDLLEKLEKLCISEEAAMIAEMRDTLRPQLEEQLQKEDAIRLDPNTNSEEYGRSVSRSVELIRNLNGKLWSPMDGETMTEFCDRVRGYAAIPKQETVTPDQSQKRVKKATNAQLKEEIIRRSDPNDPYIEAVDMKKYDVSARKKEIGTQIRYLRAKLLPTEEQKSPQEQKPARERKAAQKEKSAQKQKTTQKQKATQKQPAEQKTIDQGWNIV